MSRSNSASAAKLRAHAGQCGVWPWDGTLSFDETLDEGKLGLALTFDLLHAALLRIHDHVAKESIAKGEWFGRKDYFKSK
jgi:hypothetical protein